MLYADQKLKLETKLQFFSWIAAGFSNVAAVHHTASGTSLGKAFPLVSPIIFSVNHFQVELTQARSQIMWAIEDTLENSSDLQSPWNQKLKYSKAERWGKQLLIRKDLFSNVIYSDKRFSFWIMYIFLTPLISKFLQVKSRYKYIEVIPSIKWTQK